MIAACVSALYSLYDGIGVSSRFTASELPLGCIREMTERAVPGLYAGFASGAKALHNVSGGTVIASPALRKMTGRQAERTLEACMAA